MSEHSLNCAFRLHGTICNCAPEPFPPPCYDPAPERQWAMTVARRVAWFSPDERRVIERIVEGIEKGREVYGPMDLANDKRDLVSEAEDEVRDFVIYRAMLRVKAEHR